MDVETVEGRYGEFTVLVDGERVVGGGPLAFLGILPSIRAVRKAIERHRAGGAPGTSV
ncbi:MAG TPA: hypothetical protein VGK94_10180 [Candidatus Polarisedimenticolia bacterium]